MNAYSFDINKYSLYPELLPLVTDVSGRAVAPILTKWRHFYFPNGSVALKIRNGENVIFELTSETAIIEKFSWPNRTTSNQVQWPLSAVSFTASKASLKCKYLVRSCEQDMIKRFQICFFTEQDCRRCCDVLRSFGTRIGKPGIGMNTEGNENPDDSRGLNSTLRTLNFSKATDMRTITDFHANVTKPHLSHNFHDSSEENDLTENAVAENHPFNTMSCSILASQLVTRLSDIDVSTPNHLTTTFERPLTSQSNTDGMHEVKRHEESSMVNNQVLERASKGEQARDMTKVMTKALTDQQKLEFQQCSLDMIPKNPVETPSEMPLSNIREDETQSISSSMADYIADENKSVLGSKKRIGIESTRKRKPAITRELLTKKLGDKRFISWVSDYSTVEKGREFDFLLTLHLKVDKIELMMKELT
ncbi:LAMI_0G16314g1_1 [Lachancea mirantina]|uniref:LAMI_0G16314g1_1 n=1 Tax=Lachancea mirantina TaxID=1230905 RepID=A0A1G4KCM3_9SACH|nr:LAMI_0G16314g1_1 [Lachancea mirantina]